jgi:hypothetical protein
MEEQRRKSNAIEQRAQESVKGRERLHASKQRAAREMRARVEKTPLPKPARRFLTQAWTDRLVFLLLRHPDGELSAEWEQALKVADELVWLFDPVSTRAKPETIERACRSVSVEIDNALDSLGGYHQHYLEELRRMLREPATIAAWHVEHADAAYSDPLETDSDSLAESSSTPRRDAAETDEPSRVEPPAAETLSPAETKMLERLHQLKFGTWFAFPGPDGVRKLKLSWLSPLTATCMFVDRSGIQAEVKPLVEVARAMVAGRIKLIARPQHQFVQRALLAIRRRLQNSMEATD